MRGMNTLLHPQGPEGEAVYWRRRAVIMFIVIAIIAAVSLVVGRVRGGGGSAEAAGTGTTAQTPGTDQTPDDDGHCVLDDVILDVVAPDGTEAGQAVEMTVQFAARAGTPCSLDLDEHKLSVTVNSGSDEYWSTATCTDAAPAGQLALMDADPVSLTVTWPGRRVGEGCSDSGKAVTAGNYAVTAELDGGGYATSQFALA
ncbi:Uncharacterised protein [Propionibacterium australiense]|uniref:Uncharacterized protein n=2 Tax=Propionibacterium australiense TaxID=119981 RepID=A0A383S5U6_9ACTN|nr:Hypothetical protein PROPAUS_1120 [Propionibacterium australiense]VEH89332.1 Uncharacterised protein [Propionibacterium australiense]